MGVLDDLPGAGGRLFHLRRLTAQPPQVAFCVGHDGPERLIHLMRDRRAHLSEHAHARDMSKRGLGDLQCFLRFPGVGDIHQRTDELLLARFG